MTNEIKSEDLFNTEGNSNVIDNFLCIMWSVYNGIYDFSHELLDEEKTKEAMDIVSTSVDVLYDVSDAVGALKVLKKITDIPTLFFKRKFERYCRGIDDIPIDERESYLRKVGKKSFNKDSAFILEIINRIEEEDKIDILLKLLEAKIYGEIDNVTYRRLVLMASHTLYNDLIYLKQDIRSDNFIITTDEQEGLLGNGWIRNLGAGFLSDNDRESKTLFAYNRIAKQFCKIVFFSDIEVVPPNDTGIVSLATSQDIADMWR